MGCKTLYKPEYAEQAEKLCLLGATDDDLADFFGVVVKTIGRWKHAQPDFVAALRRGKTDADIKVAQSLYDKAMSGDTTACIFWLKNRRTGHWRDKREHDVQGKMTLQIVTFDEATTQDE